MTAAHVHGKERPRDEHWHCHRGTETPDADHEPQETVSVTAIDHHGYVLRPEAGCDSGGGGMARPLGAVAIDHRHHDDPQATAHDHHGLEHLVVTGSCGC